MYSKFYVRVTRLAEYKLYNILDYIGNYSLKLSLKIEKSFYKKLILIEQFPRIYQKISYRQFPDIECRGMVIDKYIFVVYTIENDLVQIVDVLPCKSDNIDKITKLL